MGNETSKKGVVVNVCAPMLFFLEQAGVVAAVRDDTTGLVAAHIPTPQAETILREALADRLPKESKE